MHTYRWIKLRIKSFRCFCLACWKLFMRLLIIIFFKSQDSNQDCEEFASSLNQWTMLEVLSENSELGSLKEFFFQNGFRDVCLRVAHLNLVLLFAHWKRALHSPFVSIAFLQKNAHSYSRDQPFDELLRNEQSCCCSGSKYGIVKGWWSWKCL